MDLSLWSSGGQVAATAVQTALMYLVAIVAARMAGRRTLAQMSAFDVVAPWQSARSSLLPPSRRTQPFPTVARRWPRSSDCRS